MAEKKSPSSNPEGNPIAYDIYGTHYPYFNTSKTMVARTLNGVRRVIAEVNPFSFRQIPNQQRMDFNHPLGFGIRHGNVFYQPDVYPNPIHYSRWFPTHYDPLKEDNFTPKSGFTMKNAPAETGLVIKSEPLPRGCQRQVAAYKRCVMVNGADKCHEESTSILSICPNWALEGLKEKERQLQKIEAIQTKQYRSVMEVSEYNKGRTNKDVSNKTWIHGTREYLRPDTIWADSRYADITQAEINEAKKRNAEREQSKIARGELKDDVIHEDHYDFKGTQERNERPLYP